MRGGERGGGGGHGGTGPPAVVAPSGARKRLGRGPTLTPVHRPGARSG
ncbi:hypothetical protein SSCG_04209 [Streptomyces clavuligerus]|nr:hypothetical protein SSCG_04209 [Streptomyces clavuligerus]